MLILGAKKGSEKGPKETKTDVPATYGKSGFDMLFAVFHRMSRKIASKAHFGGPGGDLVAPRLIFGSQLGSLLEPRSLKRGFGMHAYTLRVPRWLYVNAKSAQYPTIASKLHLYFLMF